MLDPQRWIAPLLALALAGGPLAAEPLRLLTADIPPFSFEAGGQPQGLAVDLVLEAFRRLNQPVDLEFVPFARAVERVRAGTADGIFPFVVSEERRGFTDYSTEPVLMDPLSLFVRADSELRFDGDYSRLSGKTIGMVRGPTRGRNS